MKKIILLIAIIAITGKIHSQILLEHSYPVSSSYISTVKLNLSGIKYMNRTLGANGVNSFTLYNSDHTIFKTIYVPVLAGYSSEVSYVSETLFNSDTLVEFMANYFIGFSEHKIYIYDENGNAIFSRDSAQIFTAPFGDGNEIYAPIVSIGDSSRLILTIGQLNNSYKEIYSLPGKLTCYECNDGVFSGIEPVNISLASPDEFSIAYPNPSAGEIKIKYTLPENVRKAFIELYDHAGNLLKKMQIDARFNEITLSNNDLAAGAYFYSLIADNKILESKKFINLKN